MAGPRIFVPGPSVNTGLIGSPAQYLNQINNIVAGRRRERVAAEKLESERIFQERTANLAERKQDFLEGAPARARAETEYQREQANLRAQAGLDAAQNAPFDFAQQFAARPEVQQLLQERGAVTPEQQLAEVLKFADSDAGQGLFRDPTLMRQAVYENLIRNKGFSAEEATAAANAAVTGEFGPSLDPSIATKLFDTGSTNVGSVFSGLGGGKGKRGSTSLFQGLPNLENSEEYVRSVAGRLGIDERRGGGMVDDALNFFGIGDASRSFWDFGARDLDMQDLETIRGRYGNQLPDYAIMGAIRSSINTQDGTIGQSKFRNIIDNPDSQDAKDFVTIAKSWQDQYERTKGGSGSLGNMSMSELVNLNRILKADQRAYNSDILARTSPQAASFADRLSGFREFLGESTPTPATAARVISQPAPDTAPDSNAASQSGSAQLDNLINQAAAPAAPATTPEPEFQVGGQIPIEAAVSSVIDAVNPAPLVQRLVNSLSPPGPGILTPQKLDTRKEREQAVKDLSSTERQQALAAAQELSRQGVIGLADGEGDSREESLLISYFKYLEAQRNR